MGDLERHVHLNVAALGFNDTEAAAEAVAGVTLAPGPEGIPVVLSLVAVRRDGSQVEHVFALAPSVWKRFKQSLHAGISVPTIHVPGNGQQRVG